MIVFTVHFSISQFIYHKFKLLEFKDSELPDEATRIPKLPPEERLPIESPIPQGAVL